MKKEEIDKYEKYKGNIQQLVSIYPNYVEKLSTLFSMPEKSISSITKQKIPKIKNHKAIINLLESRELQQEQSKQKKMAVWSLVTEIIGYYFVCFEPNLICVQAEVEVIRTGNIKYDFLGYVGEKILEFEQMGQSEISDTCMKICELLIESCSCLESSLRWITRKLTCLYYEQKLSGKIFGKTYSLLSKSSLTNRAHSFLYFDGSSSSGLKVQLSQSKWPFQKGMRLCMWIKTFQKKSQLLHLLTDEGMELCIILDNGELEVECRENKSKMKLESSRRVGPFPINKIVKLQIVLQPKDFGFFKDTNYQLHLFVDDYQATNVEVHVPKFTSSQHIAEFNLLCKFVGVFYGLCLSQRSSTITPKAHPQRETEVLSLLEGISTDLLCFVSPLRTFHNILLNYKDPEYNHICFEAKTVHQCSSDIKPLATSEIILPLLYFCSLHPDEKANLSMNMIIFEYCQGIQNAAFSEDVHKTLLFIFYFLELSDYPIDEAVAKMLYQIGHPIVNKYLNYAILQARNIKLAEYTEPNPVTKLQLLFHLETQWKKEWNYLQQTSQFWQPQFYSPQNDQPFDPAHYFYSHERGKCKYRLSDLITEDFSHCVLEVLFPTPKYSKLTYYQEQYLKKQCAQEYFEEKMSYSGSYPAYTLEKVAKSTLNKLKQKIWRNSTKLIKQRLQKPSKEFLLGKILKEPILFECCWISLLSLVVGVLRVDGQSLIFTGTHDSKRFDHMCIKGWKNEEFIWMELKLSNILLLEPRRYNQSMSGLEIMMKDGHHRLFYFYQNNLDKFLILLEGTIPIQINSYHRYLSAKEPINWIEKKMSNYHYVLWLNRVAGRSYTDITQYPVMPWVLVTNEQQLEWSNSNFRDLSKNMGSFGPEQRTDHFLDKFTTNNETEIFNEYHFGTHYSSSAIICNYLVRLEPFSTGARALQSGKFDVADRVFYSYHGSWINATYSPTDIRELIPEIYSLPQLYLNVNNYDFGLTQQKHRICNVHLPKWTHSNPYVFCAQARRSFEKDIVSNKLNNWIDLIFGYKQKGKAAVEAMNIYFPLTYENAINLEKVSDLEEKVSMETQIAHFGQNPAQIIGSLPHPSRIKVKQKWEKKLLGDATDTLIQRCSMNYLRIKQNFFFGSVFEDKNAILSIKFLNEDTFFVLRKYQFGIFKVLPEKQGYISKQRQTDYLLEPPENPLNYKTLPTSIPMTVINESIVVVGGFYFGYVQILWLNEMRFSDRLRLPHESITALESWKKDGELYLYVGDEKGVLGVYEVTVNEEFIRFREKCRKKVHLGRINHISIKEEARLFTTTGNDGKVKVFNLHSILQYKWFQNPANQPVLFASIGLSPLFVVTFYSPSNNTIYSYSINGQYLSSVEEPTSFLYNMSVVKASDFSEALVYLNSQREVLIEELPELNRKKKIRLKKDEYKVSCFHATNKLAIIGYQDGTIQMIGDPSTL